MFTILAFVVGVSEELIFRGYLYSYLQEYWSVSDLVSLIIVNAVFGLLHFHQGRSAIIDTATLGIAMSQLYIQSGSLLLPIIFHILYDLKIVLITRKLGMHKTHLPI
ncbi:CPBP family intramembrane glutamic endopeptidase [Paenibacillus oleatilyticus]|uniref:CPBP family intramembrane glutamic endopeptidase n=1 Tax=Paenibacillus oleatilyticus TaxID=2594886 RepID=UPI001C1FF2F1|nr:CPBP family intramembrane glutamic endopeptidase [Paenibacillus oleatilyticus]MBU7319042.1 CPBP family intramembrane metalloprotease [Paenibacillus oleatilyticus]